MAIDGGSFHRFPMLEDVGSYDLGRWDLKLRGDDVSLSFIIPTTIAVINIILRIVGILILNIHNILILSNLIIPTIAGYVKIASKLQSNPTAVHFGGGGIVLRQTQDSSGRSKSSASCF